MPNPTDSQNIEMDRERDKKPHREEDRDTGELGEEIPQRTGELSKRDWTGPSAPPVPNAPPPAPLQKD